LCTRSKKHSSDEEAALARHFRASPYLGQTDIFTIEQFPTTLRQFNSKASPDAPCDTVQGVGPEAWNGSTAELRRKDTVLVLNFN